MSLFSLYIFISWIHYMMKYIWLEYNQSGALHSVKLPNQQTIVQSLIPPTPLISFHTPIRISQGSLFAVVRTDETIWTIEDKKILHIAMTKADACTKETVWGGLLKDEYLADPWTLHEMRKKLDLERFQIEVCPLLTIFVRLIWISFIFLDFFFFLFS